MKSVTPLKSRTIITSFYRVYYRIDSSKIVYKKIVEAIDEKDAKVCFERAMQTTKFKCDINKIELARM